MCVYVHTQTHAGPYFYTTFTQCKLLGGDKPQTFFFFQEKVCCWSRCYKWREGWVCGISWFMQVRNFHTELPPIQVLAQMTHTFGWALCWLLANMVTSKGSRWTVISKLCYNKQLSNELLIKKWQQESLGSAKPMPTSSYYIP